MLIKTETISNKSIRVIMTTLDFRCIYWSYEDANSSAENEGADDQELYIHVGGLTEDNKTVHLRVENFRPYVRLELPPTQAWNKEKARMVFEHFQKTFKFMAPVSYTTEKRYKFKYKRLTLLLNLYFKTAKASNIFASRINKGEVIIPGIGSFKKGMIIAHENRIDPIIKFTAIQNIKLAGWVSVKPLKTPRDNTVSFETSADINIRAKYTDVIPSNKESRVFPKYCSFDIECNSKNHNAKIPDPSIPENYVVQASMIFGKVDGPESRRLLLSLFKPNDIPGVEVIRLGSERELLLKFAEIVREENNDIFTGYNIIKFDWTYLIKRAQLNGCIHDFMDMSRIFGKEAEVATMTWSSSAYGKQSGEYVHAHGRTSIDVMIEVERNFRLLKNTLDFASETFLKEKKEDVTPRQLFIGVRLNQTLLAEFENLPEIVPKSQRREIKKRIQNIFPLRFAGGARCLLDGKYDDSQLKSIIAALKETDCRFINGNIPRLDLIKSLEKGKTPPRRISIKPRIFECRDALMAAKTGPQFLDALCEIMSVIGSYCVKDSHLAIRLLHKLNVMISAQELSNITCVPISYLQTRGQQIRALAQLYRVIVSEGYFIPFDPDQKEGNDRYQGAVVFEAKQGYWEKVATTDFQSLYPSMVIAYNICETTIVSEEDKVPDEEVHILHVNEHVGCPHDILKRKRKKEAMLCCDNVYRFRKVKIDVDETGKIVVTGEGIFPRVIRLTLEQRKMVKKLMEKGQATLKMHDGLATEEDFEFYKKLGYKIIQKGELSGTEETSLRVEVVRLNAEQNALKVCANSMYGVMGVKMGALKFIPGASSVTAMGRKSILSTNDYIQNVLGKKYGVTVDLIYGDSVPGDTPILCKSSGANTIKYVPIKDLANGLRWEYRNGKETCKPYELEVWSDTGFTKVKYIIKHATNKTLYRVSTTLGEVDVTEDHSLLLSDGSIISPKEVKIGDVLLHTFLPRDSPLLISLGRNINHRIKQASDYFYKDAITKDLSTAKILSIVPLPPYEKEVYDLETETHKFAAGVGKLVVHNTDSSMIRFRGKDILESYELGDKMSKDVTHYLKCSILGLEVDHKLSVNEEAYTLDKFPRTELLKLAKSDQILIKTYDYIPINLNFENLYKKYLLLTKKRYVAVATNRKGQTTDTIKKGIVLARRNNCRYLRDTYMELINLFLADAKPEELYYALYDRIHKLFTRQIPDSHLLIYQVVQDVLNYAKSKNGVYIDANKKSLLDQNGKLIRECDKINPLDERLEYKNLPQCALSLKMLRRGETIPPNTRLEFVYIQSPSKKLGDKLEDYTYYLEHKRNIKLDYTIYIERQLLKPITELLNLKSPPERIEYEKLEDKILRLMDKLDELHTKALGKFQRFDDKVKYVIQKEKSYRTMVSDGKPVTKSSCISYKTHKDLVDSCHQLNSKIVLNAIRKKYGFPPIKNRNPKRCNIKLLVPYEGYPKDTFCKFTTKRLDDVDPKTGKKKNIKFYEMPDGKMLDYISPDCFCTWYYRGNNLLEQILHTREQFQEVMTELRTKKCE